MSLTSSAAATGPTRGLVVPIAAFDAHQPATADRACLTFGGFQLDPRSGQLHTQSGPLAVTPKALALLEYLAARPGQLVTKHELLEAIWPGVFVGDGALKVCVREIRRVLGDDVRQPRFIETAHRRGYRFIAPVSAGQRHPRPTSDKLGSTTGSGGGRPAELDLLHAPIQYARSGDVNIAYQVIGNGPIDLVFVMGWVSHLEYFWKEPSFARFLTRLASFSRLILFDKRGTGLSDPVTRLPTLEQRMDDVRAVLDAVGSTRAVLLGVSEGGPMCSLFAASYPQKTEALIMTGTYARRLRAPDYPWAPTREQREAFLEEILNGWGGPVGIETRAPSQAHDPAFREWWAAYLRMGASPAAAVALTRMNAEIDVRHILPTVRVPTLVLHRSGDRCLLVEEGRYVASLIPEARFVELPGDDHLPFVGDQDALLDEIERFLSRERKPVSSNFVLATVMSCGVHAAAPGDRVAATTRLHAIVTSEVTQFGSARVERHDDHVFGVFDGPARAIRCARAITTAAHLAGLTLQVGLHTGECDAESAARGLVAEICARAAALARPGEIVVTRTVVDLVAGSGLAFVDRGRHALAGGVKWRVFTVQRDEVTTPATQHRHRRARRISAAPAGPRRHVALRRVAC